MKKIITYGTFDLLHYGHILLLRRAKELGDYLIVGLSSDEFNMIKGKKSALNFEERKQLLESLVYVDEVIEEKDWNQKKADVVFHGIDIFVMGNDWEGKFDFLSEFCKVVYLKRTNDISTTEIKKVIGL